MKFILLLVGPYVLPVLIGLLTAYLANKKINKIAKRPRDFYGGEPMTKKAMNEYVNKKCKEPEKNESLKDLMLNRIFGEKGD